MVPSQINSSRPTAFVLTTTDVICLGLQITAALAAPCLLCLPLLAALGITVWVGLACRSWQPNGGSSLASPALLWLGVLHLYCGLAVLGLYVWQMPPTRPGNRLTEATGLVRFQDWDDLRVSVRLRLITFLMLFGALAATRLERICSQMRERSARSALAAAVGPSVSQALGRVIPAALELVAAALRGVARAVPAVLPCAMMAIALALPSVAGMVLVALALPGVILIDGQPLLLSLVAAGVAQAWAIACYTATALVPLVPHPGRIFTELGALPLAPAAKAAGLLAALLALGAMLVARLATSGTSQDDDDDGPRRALLPSSEFPASTQLRTVRPRASSGIWERLLSFFVCAVWYAGFPTVYGLVYVVGTLRYDALHAAYLLGLLALLIRRAVLFRPRLYQSQGESLQPVFAGCTHLVLRCSVAFHFTVFYAAVMIRSAFGVPAVFDKPVWQWIGLGKDIGAVQGLPLIALLLTVR